tara:strand:+ start:51 stop:635 length:585 start_codon:yes stop_codon:yes gene_type:complete
MPATATAKRRKRRGISRQEATDQVVSLSDAIFKLEDEYEKKIHALCEPVIGAVFYRELTNASIDTTSEKEIFDEVVWTDNCSTGYSKLVKANETADVIQGITSDILTDEEKVDMKKYEDEKARISRIITPRIEIDIDEFRTMTPDYLELELENEARGIVKEAKRKGATQMSPPCFHITKEAYTVRMFTYAICKV